MTTKDYLLPLIIIPAGILFLVISALVFFSNGRSARLIKYKLKLGAILLTFVLMFSQAQSQKDVRLCYKVAIPPVDMKQIKTYNAESIKNTVIEGYLKEKGDFVYQICKKANLRDIVCSGELTVTDSTTYRNHFQFKIMTEQLLKEGKYTLIIKSKDKKKVFRKVMFTIE